MTILYDFSAAYAYRKIKYNVQLSKEFYIDKQKIFYNFYF